MELLPNSSLHEWISFDENAPWNNVNNVNNVSFPPCQYVNWTTPNADEPTHNLSLPIITNTSCTQVCNDSRSLFGWQNNLVTCGLWSSLVYAYNLDGSAPDPNRHIENASVDLLNSFANVGLDANDPEYIQWAVSYADVMSACFVYLYQNVKAWKSADDGSVSGACIKNSLFPDSPAPNRSYLSSNSADASIIGTALTVGACLVDICSPVALNPEFAGVGFVISFIIQSSIAVMAFVLLLVLESWHRSNKVALAALINFHQAQCYFSSTVQIAGLMSLPWLGDTRFILNDGDFTAVHSMFVDTSVLIVLATSGFIPVTFGLAAVTRFGRASWRLIILSLITFALATATLWTFYHYDRQYGKLDDYYNSLQNEGYRDYGSCAIEGRVGDTLFPLCGSSLLNNNAISSSTITKWWVLFAWAICMAWMLLCFHSKLMEQSPPKTVRSKLDSALNRYPWMKLRKTILGRLNGRTLIFIVTAAFCFGVQFYFIHVFDRHDLVSQVWSFGQIIAVTVWIPSMFEFLIPACFPLYYVLRCKCFVTFTQSFEDWLSSADGRKGPMKPKYPSPLGIMGDIVQQTVAMANYRPIGKSNYAASSSSDIEAVPLQSPSSAVDSHGTGQEDQQ